jgi:hypothetical protein
MNSVIDTCLIQAAVTAVASAIPAKQGIAKTKTGPGWGTAEKQWKQLSTCFGWKKPCSNKVCNACHKDASTELKLSMMMQKL